jgi:acyl carrier protein
VTPHQAALAAEIARLAREELHLEVEGGPDDELAARLDSMALLALVTAVEDRFRVILTEEDAAVARSLADLARLVEAKQAARPQGRGDA